MPGNYKRKSTRHSWSKEDMAKAIESIKEKKMGWLKASRTFNVPQATLRRHFEKVPANLGRFKPTFEAEIEQQLVQHILHFEERFFGFNTTDVRKLAYQFARKAGLPNRFDNNAQMAGWDWLKGFRKRNPSISLRAPEATSAARARGFNEPQVMKFFDILEKLVNENDFSPAKIYNMDESGLSTVQKPPRIFAQRGKKQVGALTSAERGQHVSIAVCANAAGNFIPPAIIIPRKNYKPEYFDSAPPGTLQLCYDSGYMVGDLFVKWMKHFVGSTGCNATNKVLLILDGHSSHKNLEALEFAKANGVILLCLPPHCTHRMQPLDVSFFGPLDSYYNREVSTWLKAHPGRTVGLYQVAGIFGKAYGSAATVGNITSGFEKTGIYPLNRHVFPDHLFLPSQVTDNDIQLEADDGTCEEGNHIKLPEAASGSTELPQNNFSPVYPMIQSDFGGACELPSAPVERDFQRVAGSSTAQCILNGISQLPKSVSTGRPRNKTKKVSGTQVLTGSPFMNEVKEQLQNKKEKERRKSVRVQKHVKRILQDDSDTEPGEDFMQDSDVDDSDVACLYCNDLYSKSKPGEHWVCCQLCKQWCHTLCAGVAPKTKIFNCELCIDN